MIFNNDKKPVVSTPISLYKWAKIFNHLQRNFFEDNDVKIRREKQIEDFIYLNEFKVVKVIRDTDVFLAPEHPFQRCEDSADADIVVITDQKFSRYPCHVMPDRIKYYLNKCPNMYLCLNRHYVNIDNSYHDTSLSDNFNLAITQWLRKALPEYQIVDMSLDYVNDNGFYFSWVVPDRHYYITKK